MDADFEISGLNLAGLKKVLIARGLLDATLARCTSETKQAVAEPHARRWHSGTIAIDTWGAIIDSAGATTYADVQHEVTAKAFGPIVTPLLKVALALGGRSPFALLKRLDDVLKVAMRNVHCSSTPVGSQATHVLFEYPRAIPRPDVVEHGWRGTLRFGETLVDKTFTFGQLVAESDRRFVLPISW